MEFDFLQEDYSLTKNVKIHFDKDLNDGFYTIVVNKETNEEKELIYDYVSFDNLTLDNYSFEVQTFNKSKKIVDKYDININTRNNKDYLGDIKYKYELSNNTDDTYNLSKRTKCELLRIVTSSLTTVFKVPALVKLTTTLLLVTLTLLPLSFL